MCNTTIKVHYINAHLVLRMNTVFKYTARCTFAFAILEKHKPLQRPRMQI